jgi:alpha-ribazole phosphatase
VPLAPEGLHQMQVATDGLRCAFVITSPARRCRAFAEAMARRVHATLALDARWAEMHFGDWEGQHASSIPPDQLAAFWRDPERCGPPGAEPFERFVARVSAAWLDLARLPGPTLVVCHGGPIRLLLCTLRNLPPSSLLSVHVPLASLHTVPMQEAQADP